MDPRGKVALVTGGASGIGAATAEALARAGAVVHVADVDDDLGADLASALGGTYHHLDVADAEAWSEVVASIAAAGAGLDIVHLNAGVMTRPKGADMLDDPRSTLTVEAWRRVSAVNLDGVVVGIVACLPALEASGGSVVVTASVAGLRGFGPDPYYSATKHAVVGLVRSLGPALEPSGVSVHAVCPGGIDTPLVPPDVRDGRAAASLADPGYIADAVLVALRSESTGTVWAAPGTTVEPYVHEAPDLRS